MLLVREENSMGLEQAQVNTVKKHSPVHSSQSKHSSQSFRFAFFQKKKEHITQAGAFQLKLLDCAILKRSHPVSQACSENHVQTKGKKRKKNHIIVTAFKLQKGI